MSNSVKYSIDGDTNAEQVSGRVKASLNGLDKQMEGIGKKFGSSFKDIFLSFLGPMALLGAAMGFIGKLIADNQKKHEDANQAAIDQTNKLMSAEDQYWANKRNNEAKAKATAAEAKLQREVITAEFLGSDPRGKAIMQRETEKMGFFDKLDAKQFLPLNKKIQTEVQAILAEDIKTNPIATGGKDTTFQGPQGFSNIIGVGANPVIENLTRQTDIQQQILEHLKSSKPMLGITDVDFTKQNVNIKDASK